MQSGFSGFRYSYAPNTADQRHEWHIANRQLRCDQVRRRPDDYVPFQSIFQPDGRPAYNPNGPQYPQQVSRGQGTPRHARDQLRLPGYDVYPRDTIRPWPLNYGAMQYGPGFAGRYGPSDNGGPRW